MPGFGLGELVAERRAIEVGRFRQFVVFAVELDAAKSGEGAADVELVANTISLEPEIWLPQMSAAVTSDTAKKVYLRFNTKDAPWIPFSLIANGKHKQVANGTIFRVWVKVPASEISAGARLYFLATLSFGLSSGTGGTSASGYVAPTGSTGGTSSGGGGGADYSEPLAGAMQGRGNGYVTL